MLRLPGGRTKRAEPFPEGTPKDVAKALAIEMQGELDGPGLPVVAETICTDGDGNVIKRWTRTKEDRDTKTAQRFELLKAAAKDFAGDFAGKAKPVPCPRKTTSDLLTVYPMGDPHFGMLAWGEETGDNFNLEIAEQTLCAAVDKLVGLAPASDDALIINLGDFFHSDSSENKTRRGGNMLDVDGRRPRVLQIGLRAMRRCVEAALEKHKRVYVQNLIGNHDDDTSAVISIFLDAFFNKNSRVRVGMEWSAFRYHRFGKNLLGMTHGDTTKPGDLESIMSCERAKDWGETEHRFWYTGHIHHDTLKEYRGCTVESFRTLAAKDAYHARHGYRAGRDMKCDIIHRDHGKINRHIVGIGQLV